MLYPEVKLIKEHAICTCGAPNFRNEGEFHKKLYDVYAVTLPKMPCGTVTHHLCRECIEKIGMSIGMNAVMHDIGKLQTSYQALLTEKKLTKKAMCELVVPFRDTYHLTDSQALQIARNELSIAKINKLILCEEDILIPTQSDIDMNTIIGQLEAWAEREERDMNYYAEHSDKDDCIYNSRDVAEIRYKAFCEAIEIITSTMHK